jgi:carboxypeptidase Taq
LLPVVERLRLRLDSRPLRSEALRGHFPIDAQRRFNDEVAARIGFDFRKGRLDEAVHPFTTSIGDDVRITTRYDEGDLAYAIYSTIHETGHGLYEQGLDPEAWGLPRGHSCSLGVHESQSRLWENQIGRSEAFWSQILPLAQRHFPALDGVPLDSVVLAVNAAGPSFIRTEADEITYNLHIILRFELERALVDGSLDVASLPQAWAEKMRTYLGIRPPDDRQGVLQDVHWASGAIGYFPTYTLGNIYAAQLVRAIEPSAGSLDSLLRTGDFAALLAWLRRHIHRLGQTYRSTELIQRATGGPPTARPLLEHLQQKVSYLESM